MDVFSTLRFHGTFIQIHDQIAPKYLRFDRGMTIMYDAGGSRAHDETGQYVNSPDYPPTRPSWAGKGRPSIHMPRAASRITLEVTGVRVERLQDISEADAQAEGAVHGPLLPVGFNWAGCDPDDAAMRSRFAVLWHGINAARGYGWDVNPWVWCIEFRRIA